MNSDDRDLLIQSFGVACANIDSLLEKLNTYEQQIVDGVSNTEENRERCDTAIMRAKGNTKRALSSAVEMNLHKSPAMRFPLSLLRSKITDMETAFDEANAEAGEDKLPFIEKAIRAAGFAKRNCDDIYELLNKPTNKGGSRKRTHRNKTLRKRMHKKRTHRSRK